MSNKIKLDAKQFAAFKEGLERGRMDKEVHLLEEAVNYEDSNVMLTTNQLEALKLKKQVKIQQLNVHDPAGTRGDIEAGK